MPLTPHRIKFLIYEAGHSPASLAERWGYNDQEFSMCIHFVPGRVYPELRILISNLIGLPVDHVFGSHPLTTELLASREEKQRSVA